jgi:TonB family protein
LAPAWTPAAAVLRQPTAQWHVDYDEAQCVAARNYGSEEKPLILALKPSPNGTVMRILVIRKGSAEAEQTPTTLSLGATRKKTHLLSYSDDKNHFRVVSINVPMSEFKANISMPSISIAGGPVNESFAITDLAAAQTELDKCLADLQDYWNIGPQHQQRIGYVASPKAPLWSLFSPSDYPGIALFHNQQGKVTMTFLVDEKGGVADCSVDETSGIPALDTMSCYVIKSRARFQPALGKNAKPIRSAYTERVVWRIAL